MSNIKKTLESGANIEVQIASFEKSHRLLQAVKKSMIPIDDVIDLIVHESVQDPLWDCMATCLYNNKKITRDTFESEESRGDYLLVAKEVMVHNLTPFFKGLASESSERIRPVSGEGQK